MNSIMVYLVTLATLAIQPAYSEENPAKAMMAAAPEAANFADCFNIVDHLVDIDPAMGFADFEVRLARQLPDMPTTRRSRVFMALGLAEEHGAKSILELGLADQFAPVFVLANKRAADCRWEGCEVTAVQSANWFGQSHSTFSGKVFGTVEIDQTSRYRFSDFIPIDSGLAYGVENYGPLLDFTIHYGAGSLFGGYPTFTELLTIVGSTKELHIGQFFVSPRCIDHQRNWRRNDPDYPECDALLKFYETYFDGDMGQDVEFLESDLPIRIISYSGPDQIMKSNSSEYCPDQSSMMRASPKRR